MRYFTLEEVLELHYTIIEDFGGIARWCVMSRDTGRCLRHQQYQVVLV